MRPRPSRSPLFPYTTLFRSHPEAITFHAEQIGLKKRRAFDQPSGVVRKPIPENVRQRSDQQRNRSADARFQIGRAQSELQSPVHLVCRLLLEKKKIYVPPGL